MNEKVFDWAHYPYIMQIVNILKQAQLIAKSNGIEGSMRCL